MSKQQASASGICVVCGAPTKRSCGRIRKTCSETCENKRHSMTMARTNRVHAAPRMRDRNPMFCDAYRLKAIRTLRDMGHQPQLRGGNGTGPTVPESTLASRLSLQTNVVVRTLMGAGSGYPSHYKVDVGDRSLKLAIEIDGSSHGMRARREQDEKKTELLESLGWTVLRFTNAEVMEHLEDVARTVSSTISRLKASTIISRTGS